MAESGAARSDRVRAAIRRPIGSAMRCFVAIVDTDGVVLGCIRTPEATLFSFDVSIQKARTVSSPSSPEPQTRPLRPERESAQALS